MPLIALGVPIPAAAAAADAEAAARVEEGVREAHDARADRGTQCLVGPPEQKPEHADAHYAHDPRRTLPIPYMDIYSYEYFAMYKLYCTECSTPYMAWRLE